MDNEEGLEVHPMVELLLTRMEHHPEEFYFYDPSCKANLTPLTNARSTQITRVFEPSMKMWNRKEKRLYNLALRKVRMSEAHVRLMAILLADKPGKGK